MTELDCKTIREKIHKEKMQGIVMGLAAWSSFLTSSFFGYSTTYACSFTNQTGFEKVLQIQQAELYCQSGIVPPIWFALAGAATTLAFVGLTARNYFIAHTLEEVLALHQQTSE